MTKIQIKGQVRNRVGSSPTDCTKLFKIKGFSNLLNFFFYSILKFYETFYETFINKKCAKFYETFFRDLQKRKEPGDAADL